MLIKKINILFLCTGNICRSPTAEGIFNKIIEEKRIKNFFYVDSAGTHGFHQGQPPDKRSQRECLKLNINISKKKSRKFKDRDLNKFDYIIAMDRTHLEFVKNKNFSGKCKLLMHYSTNRYYIDVPDPYFGNEKNFSETFEIILEGINGLVDYLKFTYKKE